MITKWLPCLWKMPLEVTPLIVHRALSSRANSHLPLLANEKITPSCYMAMSLTGLSSLVLEICWRRKSTQKTHLFPIFLDSVKSPYSKILIPCPVTQSTSKLYLLFVFFLCIHLKAIKWGEVKLCSRTRFEHLVAIEQSDKGYYQHPLPLHPPDGMLLLASPPPTQLQVVLTICL